MVAAQDIIEPKVGMKFSIKAVAPQTNGKSKPEIRVTKKTSMPVKSEIKNFMEKEYIKALNDDIGTLESYELICKTYQK